MIDSNRLDLSAENSEVIVNHEPRGYKEPPNCNILESFKSKGNRIDRVGKGE